MKLSLTIDDLTTEDNLLISKFVDLLSRSGIFIPEIAREPTGKIYHWDPTAVEKIEKIKKILEED